MIVYLPFAFTMRLTFGKNTLFHALSTNFKLLPFNCYQQKSQNLIKVLFMLTQSLHH